MIDPGPPPTDGVVIRATDQGFHARVWPQPPVPWRRIGLGGAQFAAAGVAVAWLTASEPGARAAVVAGILLFGALLGALAVGQDWLPAELEVDDSTVYWNGDRIPMADVRGARADGPRLVLVGASGELATLAHLRPEVARWLADAIRASLPPPA